MTSAQIRQSFLDFFRSKQHTIVPSSSLMPDSPNLLFTNAGMNQFVPIFLAERKPDVSKWAGAVPSLDTRAADTQKCIRAGGKHNDLEDVGLDTYHHTFFEMLGNWSFGDYFKRESLQWGWELITKVWKFPAQRLYATVYSPNKAKGDPSDFDQEAYDIWAELFRAEGLDPAAHIVNGGKKDNFWMMGDTGPCGPCSEIHVDLTPAGDTKGALVNQGTAECIEIWNHVFIQFNANPDGTFSPLPAKHVDTGMGFERVASIIQGTRGFTDFANAKISNYETDIFRPIFDRLEKLSGQRYGSTLPAAGTPPTTEQEKVDVAFRVIADHIRTLSFAIADGIQPGNSDRNYVLRRILRRAVRYGRTLGFRQPFFYQLVDVLVETMGEVFPEIRARQQHVKDVIRVEEEAFNRTLDRGIELFEGRAILNALGAAASSVGYEVAYHAVAARVDGSGNVLGQPRPDFVRLMKNGAVAAEIPSHEVAKCGWKSLLPVPVRILGRDAFELYDTYGFPLDLTELMARERGLTVDVDGFNALMEEQRTRARAAQKKQVIELSQIETKTPTQFVGYDALEAPATVLEVVQLKDRTAVVTDASPCYAEMGGQVGDTGELAGSGQLWRIATTQKSGPTWLHFLEAGGADHDVPVAGGKVTLRVEAGRRNAIQRHHTVTHLLHWALHEVVSQEASQKGSFVGPDKLTFDFNSPALTPQQVADIERLVNDRILENAGVGWTEVPYADVKSRKDVMQFFGDKYGDVVRVVQIGGRAGALDGYSMELCGGTHTRATGEIGLFRIVAESAIAAGVRRIEAVAGATAFEAMRADRELIRTLAGRVNSPLQELDKKIEALLAREKELEKALKAAAQREAAARAKDYLARAETVQGVPVVIANLGAVDGDAALALVEALRSQFKGVVVVGSTGGSVAIIASVSAEYTSRLQAGKIIQTIAPIVGGKGGGKPDFARGGGKDAAKLDEALAKARTLLG